MILQLGLCMIESSLNADMPAKFELQFPPFGQRKANSPEEISGEGFE